MLLNEKLIMNKTLWRLSQSLYCVANHCLVFKCLITLANSVKHSAGHSDHKENELFFTEILKANVKIAAIIWDYQ